MSRSNGLKTSAEDCRNQIVKLGNIVGRGKSQGGSVFGVGGVSPSLIAGMSHGNVMPFIVEIKEMNECERLGNVYNEKYTGANFGGHVWNSSGIAPAMHTGASASQQFTVETRCVDGMDFHSSEEPWVWVVNGVKYRIRIRKLTPRECWRLMGFTDEDFEAAESVCSNTQLYKQCGNSICKNVIMALFSQMIEK